MAHIGRGQVGVWEAVGMVHVGGVAKPWGWHTSAGGWVGRWEVAGMVCIVVDGKPRGMVHVREEWAINFRVECIGRVVEAAGGSVCQQEGHAGGWEAVWVVCVSRGWKAVGVAHVGRGWGWEAARGSCHGGGWAGG